MFVPRGVPHDVKRVLDVLDLRQAGMSIPAIAVTCDLPQGTVSRWCGGRLPAVAARVRETGCDVPAICQRCGRPEHADLPTQAYSYLLGIYLGDGCLGPAGRTVALRITMDASYPGIIDEVSEAIVAVRRGGRVSAYRPPSEHCVVLTSYTRAWRCLFPQHGAGKKHERPIVLEPWQQTMVRDEPGRFLRGLIHSDGWRGVNCVRVKGRDYRYPRYQFSNRSADIRRLFTDSCDELGVEWRPWGPFHISVSRRRSVALLDEHVGLKS